MRIACAAAVAALVCVTGPVFAQDISAMSCAEYAASDNAGQMTIMAELQALNAEANDGQETDAAAINAELSSNCTANPDMLVMDAWKEMHM